MGYARELGDSFERGRGGGDYDGRELFGWWGGLECFGSESGYERREQCDVEWGGPRTKQGEQQGARGLVGGRGDDVGIGLAGDVQDRWQGGGKPEGVADRRSCCRGLDKSKFIIRPRLNMDDRGVKPGDWRGEQHDAQRDRAWEQWVQWASAGRWDRRGGDGVGFRLWYAVQNVGWDADQRLAWDDERAACGYADMGGVL